MRNATAQILDTNPRRVESGFDQKPTEHEPHAIWRILTDNEQWDNVNKLKKSWLEHFPSKFSVSNTEPFRTGSSILEGLTSRLTADRFVPPTQIVQIINECILAFTTFKDTTRETHEEIINAIRSMKHHEWSQKVAERLLYLMNAAHENDPPSEIRLASLQQFYEFLAAHPTIKCPSITINPTGNLIARWKGPLEQLFSMEFSGGETVPYVVFKRDTRRNGNIERTRGQTALDRVVVRARDLDVDWAF